jgi:hypothetical protein
MNVQIKYEVEDESDLQSDCISSCSYGCDMNVGSDSCRFDGYPFVSDEGINHIVTYKGKSPEDL